MYRATKALAIVLCAAWTVATARASDTKQARAETVTKADAVFRLHYTPHPDQPLRAFDKDRESGPADTAIYWFNANYVARLVFATDGSLARIELLPEALLYSDTWTSVPDT